MKEFFTLQKTNHFNMYSCLQAGDYRFSTLFHILYDDFMPYQLINWFFNKEKVCFSGEWVFIEKQNNIIALYDISDSMDEDYTGEFLNPEKRFEMTKENFIELLYHWEELRVSKPDTILIVIHEDNYITLETDPVIIKQYQHAGYAFDINKSKN